MPQLNAYGIMNVEKKTVVNCVYEADKHVAKGSNIEIEFMSGQKVVSKINELHLSYPPYANPVLSIVIDDWIDERECGRIKSVYVYKDIAE